MDFKEYQEKAIKTAIYSENHCIVYPALGLANEAGEVLGKIKKVLRDYNGEFTAEQEDVIASEMGDVLWYLAALARDLHYELDTIAEMNIAKLEDRQKRNVLKGSGDNR